MLVQAPGAYFKNEATDSVLTSSLRKDPEGLTMFLKKSNRGEIFFK